MSGFLEPEVNAGVLDRRANTHLITRTGKRITPHILRHTAATNLLQRGCPVGHIKEILGHQNLARNPPEFEYEGAFRSWLFRILIDKALAVLLKTKESTNDKPL